MVTRPRHVRITEAAREVLFVPLDAETRYKAKNFLDVMVFRGADAAGPARRPGEADGEACGAEKIA